MSGGKTNYRGKSSVDTISEIEQGLAAYTTDFLHVTPYPLFQCNGTKMIGAITILINLMKASPSGLIFTAIDGANIPSSKPGKLQSIRGNTVLIERPLIRQQL